MKILIVSAYASPHVGGVEVVVAQQARTLAELGHQVTVFTSSAGATKGEEVVDGYQLIRRDAWNGLEKRGAPFPLWGPSALRCLARLVRSSDVVHVHDANYQSSVAAGLFAKLFRRRLLMTQHVSVVDHDSPAIRWLQQVAYALSGRKLWSWASQVTVYNAAVQRFLIGHGVQPAKILLSYNGIDTSYFRPGDATVRATTRARYGLPLDKPLVLFVGRLVPKKGVTRLIAADDPMYQIVLVGTGTEPEHADTVSYLGPVDRQELRNLYQACDLFAFPAAGEVLTLVMQEAMACGLPVVATSERDYDIYQFDPLGIELISTDPETLRSSFRRILGDPCRLEYMREYSRAIAEERFDWRANALEMASSYAD